MAPGPVRRRAEAAHAAARVLATASNEARRDAVLAYAEALDAHRDAIEEANAADRTAAEQAVAAGALDAALLQRLSFEGTKIDQAIDGLRDLAALADPIGRTVRATRLDDGLDLRQVTVPLGVIACAFESRPDAAVQVAALCMRTGNAVLLKGGKEASRSNALLAELARASLAVAGLPEDGVVPIVDRTELQALLALDDLIDLVVPRGSNAFVRFVQDNTRIAVLGHADGVCHTYLDEHVDLELAIPVCVDAKTDYAAACNATECFLVHEARATEVVPALAEALAKPGVIVRADERAHRLAPSSELASDEDWGREYGEMTCAIKVVASLDEAIDHIDRYGSGHTDAILTEDATAAERFLAAVDSAGVYWNASTRFADGYRYGLGAEVGISTGKVHARGPVGLDGLTTTKWLLRGTGQRASTYQGEQARAFKHEPLPETDHDA